MSFVEKVKRYYELGLWDVRKVADAVSKGKISAEDFKAITGEDYNAD